MTVSISLLIMPLSLLSRVWFAFVAAAVHWLAFSFFSTRNTKSLSVCLLLSHVDAILYWLVGYSRCRTFHLSLLNFMLVFLGHYPHLCRCHCKISLLSEVFISPRWQQFGVISKPGEGAPSRSLIKLFKSLGSALIPTVKHVRLQNNAI